MSGSPCAIHLKILERLSELLYELYIQLLSVQQSLIVGYNRVRMKILRLHGWRVSPREAAALQNALRSRIEQPKLSGSIGLIAGADAAFSRDAQKVYGAVCILSFPDLHLVEERTAARALRFPYMPGLLTFREGPALLACFEQVTHTPDVILFDGQGIMHPRRMGIATHLGILLDTPSIGCAKRHLFGEYDIPDRARGSYTPVYDKGKEQVGACLRTREHVNPVFVSTGTGIDLVQAIALVLQCSPCYRIPDPLRRAHARAQARKRAGL